MTDKYDERAAQIDKWHCERYAMALPPELLSIIAAALREAVLEARIEMREGLVYSEGVAWGKAEAYADAAKISKGNDPNYVCDYECSYAIAKLIGARAQELGL